MPSIHQRQSEIGKAGEDGDGILPDGLRFTTPEGENNWPIIIGAGIAALVAILIITFVVRRFIDRGTSNQCHKCTRAVAPETDKVPWGSILGIGKRRWKCQVCRFPETAEVPVPKYDLNAGAEQLERRSEQRAMDGPAPAYG